MHFHTYIDSSTSAGSTTIAGISTQGSTYGVGISSDIQGRNVSISGIVSSSELKIGNDVTVSVGVVTAMNGFISVGNTTPIQISLSGNTLSFTAVGIGSTFFTLS